ncbi:MAG: hypothetical protein ACR2IJ_05800 [Fluviibacter sp.]
MSLEQKLKDNTAALERLTNLLTDLNLSVIQIPTVPTVPTVPAPIEEPVTYAEVTRAVTQAAGFAGREAVIQMLQEQFGLASAKTAKADQYGDIIAACEALKPEVA